MPVDPLLAGALLILFVTFWFVAGLVDGTRPAPARARTGSPVPDEPHQPNRERELTHH